MRAVLVGNQNCGKSTIFNMLTGVNQKIGNWPGVTVERKSGVIHNLDIEVVDLPGIYSLSPYTLEEKISYGYLMNEKYDLIINVVDCTTLERGLFLTSELLELHKNMIVVLNMMDKLEKKGIDIHIPNLINSLGVDVCIMSATRGNGILQLLQMIEKHLRNGINNVYQKISTSNFENENAIVLRYKWLDDICRKCIKHKKKTKNKSSVLDKIFLNSVLAIPLFFIIMLGMYFISIEIFGNCFSGYMTNAIDALRNFIGNLFNEIGVSEWLISLICNGIIAGVGSILSFLPQLVVIFFITSFLEACGYLARVAFIFDKILKKWGLNGKSLISYILGMGCSVPGILSTKIIENEEERRNTIITTSFIPCSAKLPMITLFSKYFFHHYTALIAVSFYIMSIIIIIGSAMMIHKFTKKSEEDLYIFELPEYRFPSVKFLYQDIKGKVMDFINKAGTTIFIASILVWFLLSFSTKFEYGVEIGDSILAFCGEKISFLFYPIIGVKSWEASVSAIQGLIAKEQVVASMEIIAGLSHSVNRTYDLFDITSPFYFFTPKSSYAYVAFNLFTTPCIAAIVTMCKELKSFKTSLLAILYQVLIGYNVAAILFKIL